MTPPSTSKAVPGTQGYIGLADDVISAVDTLAFDDVHRPVLQFVPNAPSEILDIGACSGRDAAALADRGHVVTAVEPVAEFRQAAQKRHPSKQIVWIADSLPDLNVLCESSALFDAIIVHAVWMHLDREERARAMPVVCGLLKKEGALILSLRHGPVPPGRRMFDVGGDETMALAQTSGLKTVLNLPDQPSALPKPNVTWTRFVFQRL